MTPPKMAAFLSAAIDGHMGLMGPGHGIRLADPDMKIVFPSPTDIRLGYILEVRSHIMDLRKDAGKYGYEVDPFKNFVITAHYYPVKGVSQRYSKGGQSVDESDIVEKSEKFLQGIRNYYPDAEVWLTESGYDKSIDQKKSRIATPVTDEDPIEFGRLSYRSQAKHLCRLALTMFETGYDKMFIFTLKDPQFKNKPGYFSTFLSSGLMHKNGDKNWSWYSMNAMRERLTGYIYESTALDGEIKIVGLRNGKRPCLCRMENY